MLWEGVSGGVERVSHLTSVSTLPSLVRADFLPSVKGPHWREFLPLDNLGFGTWFCFSPVSRLRQKLQLFLSLGATGLDIEIRASTALVSACWWAMHVLGLVNLHNHTNQHLRTCLCHTHTRSKGCRCPCRVHMQLNSAVIHCSVTC